MVPMEVRRQSWLAMNASAVPPRSRSIFQPLASRLRSLCSECFRL